jgi:hypothetical protein
MREINGIDCSLISGGEDRVKEALGVLIGTGGISCSSGVTGGACTGIGAGGVVTGVGIVPVAAVGAVAISSAYIGYEIGQQTGFHDWLGDQLAPWIPTWAL